MTSSIKYRNTPRESPVEIRLRYLHRSLTLHMRSPSRNFDVNCGTVEDIDLPQLWHFGITATTGQIVDNHDVLAFYVRPLGETLGDVQQPLDVFDHESEQHERKFWETATDQSK